MLDPTTNPDESINAPRPSDREKQPYPDLKTLPAWIAPRDLEILEIRKNHIPLVYDGQIVVEGTESFVEAIVELNRSDLPPIEVITPDILDNVTVSTRSCLAQGGAFLYAPNRLPEEQITALNKGDSVRLPLLLRVFGSNPMIFQQGDKIGRFFSSFRGDCLDNICVRGEEIDSVLAGGGDSWIIGEPGKDFTIVRRIHPDGSKTAIGAVMILSNSRFHIPQTGYPIRIASRQDLYALQKEYPLDHQEVRDEQLAVLQSRAKVNLPKDVMAVIQPLMYIWTQNDPETIELLNRIEPIHLPSQLIDPGSNWRIRMEILQRIEGLPPSNGVFLKFYRSPLLRGLDASSATTYPSSVAD